MQAIDLTPIFSILSIVVPAVAIFAIIRAVNLGSVIAMQSIDRLGETDSDDEAENQEEAPQGRVFIVVLKIATQIVSLFIILTTIGFFIPLVLRLFPATRELAAQIDAASGETFGGFSDGAADLVPTIIFIVITVVVVFYTIRILRVIFTEIENSTLVLGKFNKDWARPTFQLLRVMILVVTVVVLYSNIPGSQTLTVQGAVLITTLVAGIGARDIIADVVSGVVLTYTSNFTVGDKIEFDGIVGRVYQKTLLNTRVKTPYGLDVSFPNGKLLNGRVINQSTFNGHPALVSTGVTISYEAPWQQVHELLYKAVDIEGVILKKPGPVVSQAQLDDFYVRYEVWFWVEHSDGAFKKLAKKTEVHNRIRDLFGEAGISLLTPQVMRSIRYTGVGDVDDGFGIDVDGDGVID